MSSAPFITVAEFVREERDYSNLATCYNLAPRRASDDEAPGVEDVVMKNHTGDACVIYHKGRSIYSGNWSDGLRTL